jgi:hypothetical protein
MSTHEEQPTNGLQALRDTSLVPDSASRAQADDGEQSLSKPVGQPRREKTGCNRPGRMSTHSVFVLDVDGKPLTPTKPSKARKLLEGGVAKKIWSKFGTFGIQMLQETRKETPVTGLGVDQGTKFEGYSVVVDKENNLNVKLDLPDKKQIRKKLEQRKIFRRARRFRKCRRRPCRSKNRSRKGFIAPSQRVIIQSRLKIMEELCRVYPVSVCGLEDVCFNHTKYRWGANFSTIEIGKFLIRKFFKDRNIILHEYKGYETSEYRKFYGYKKTRNKSEDRFESHCSDSLTLACTVSYGYRVEIGPFLVVDDVYRCVRRKLHDSKPSKRGIRDKYSTGNVNKLRKGLLVGTKKRSGRLCGVWKDKYLYHDCFGKRKQVRNFIWVSSSFIMKKMGRS